MAHETTDGKALKKNTERLKDALTGKKKNLDQALAAVEAGVDHDVYCDLITQIITDDLTPDLLKRLTVHLTADDQTALGLLLKKAILSGPQFVPFLREKGARDEWVFRAHFNRLYYNRSAVQADTLEATCKLMEFFNGEKNAALLRQLEEAKTEITGLRETVGKLAERLDRLEPRENILDKPCKGTQLR